MQMNTQTQIFAAGELVLCARVNRTVDASGPWAAELTAPASIVQLTRAVSNLLSETRKRNTCENEKSYFNTLQM